MKIKQLKSEISDLPIEERAEAVDQILKFFNRPDPEVEKAWAKEARQRLDEFKAGKVKAILGDQVHRELRKKYST